MNKLLLAGVGDLNKRLARLALLDGAGVEGLRRSASDPELGFTQHAIDLSRQPWPDCHASHLSFALSARERTESAYRAAYVEPIEQLAASIADWQTLPTRIVIVSSTRVYGEDGGQLLDDEYVADTRDPYGQILLEMEHKARQLPCQVVIARLSGIYGPGRDWLKRMALSASKDSLENGWTNRIHIDDAAQALWHLLTLPMVESHYLITDTAPKTRYEMYNYFRQKAGAELLTPEPPALTGKQLIPSRLQASGFQWRYPDAFSGGYE